MKRIFIHGSRLFIEYKIKREDFNNTHFNNEPWHIKEYWSIYIGFHKKLWEYEDLYYDGHTAKSITIFGLTIGKTYSYESKSLMSWGNELLV